MLRRYARRQFEVDFLLRRGKEHLALEVKSQTRFPSDQLVGLRAIAEVPRVVRRVLVYLGERRLKTADGIEVWPLAAFLEAVGSRRLWP
jgi:predicted AAA+ superfamily ATPase